MPNAYVLKVRGGSDTYVKQDGTTGTAGKGALIEKEVAFTLAATQDQTLFQSVIPIKADATPKAGDDGDPAFTLRVGGDGGSHDFIASSRIISLQGDGTTSLNVRGSGFNDDGCSFTLNLVDRHSLAYEHIVRRLTPTECERLQGFPDGWTDVPWKGKEHAPDTLRYRALGNSMATPCMFWIGKRLEFVEREVLGLQEQNFRKARMEAGIRAERAAAELDVSITTLLNWERGDTRPNADKLAAMAKLYGTTADYLLQLA